MHLRNQKWQAPARYCEVAMRSNGFWRLGEVRSQNAEARRHDPADFLLLTFAFCLSIFNRQSKIRNRRFYSYLSASTGSSFEARSAGTNPLITPTTSSTAVESSTVASEIRRWISPLPESSSNNGPIIGSVPTAAAIA